MKRIMMTMIFFILFSSVVDTLACTRVVHVSKDGNYVITGRNMDWYLRYPVTLWKFPRGMERSGLTEKNRPGGLPGMEAL